jgi:hypothetical protein
MKKFRLPRKIKKKLSGRIFLYQPEDDGSRTVAFPKDNQVDYTAVKTGIATDFLREIKATYKSVTVKIIKD